MLRAWIPLSRGVTTLRWATRCRVGPIRLPSAFPTSSTNVFSTFGRRSFTAPPKVPPPTKLKGSGYFIPDQNGKFLEEDLEAPRFPQHAFSSFMWVLDLTRGGPEKVPLEEINPVDLAFAIAVYGYAALVFTPDKLSEKQNAVWIKNNHTYGPRIKVLCDIQAKYFSNTEQDPTSEPGLLRKKGEKEDLLAWRVQPLPDETIASSEPIPFALPKSSPQKPTAPDTPPATPTPTPTPTPKVAAATPSPPTSSASSKAPTQVPPGKPAEEKPAEEILDASYFSQTGIPTLLTFDTETNDHPTKNPIMIELGWCLFDAQGKIIKGYPKSELIAPEKWGPTFVDPKTEEIHGICYKDLQQLGKPLVDVLKLFSADLKQVMATDAGRVGSYNLEFDQKMLLNSLEATKAFPSSVARIKTLFRERGVCVMEEVTKLQKGTYCKLSAALQKYAKIPDDKKQELINQNHHAATDSLVSGLVLFGIKK